jgi:hypothetical protein
MEEWRGEERARGVEGEGRRKPRVACRETRRTAAATKRERMVRAGWKWGVVLWCVLGRQGWNIEVS